MSTIYDLLNKLKNYTKAMLLKNYPELAVKNLKNLTTMAARAAVGQGIPAMPSIGVAVPKIGIPLAKVPNVKTSLKMRAVGVGAVGVGLSTWAWSIFRRDFSTSRGYFNKTEKLTVGKEQSYQKKTIGFLTLLFFLQSLLVISFVYIGFNSYVVSVLQAAVVGQTMFDMFSKPFWELLEFFKISHNFWNFTMGVAASRWCYLCLMMLFFRGRNTTLLDDSENLWLPYYIHKFRARVLVLQFLEKYEWFNKLTVLDKELCKIFMYKTFVYFVPFIINLVVIREYNFYVFFLGILIMLLYQYCRFCFLLIIVFFYNVSAYYNLFPMHYTKNYQQFWPIVLMLNLAYNILLSLLILALYTDLYTSPVLDQYLPVITVFFLAVSFNYCIFYAVVRCLAFVLVQFLLFLGLDLHKHFDVNRKFLEYNYDFIAFCVVLLYTLLTLLRS